jgi:L,D-peptidoglycan transpeptidase YkuD (ErfK/YbiS/YcfS/YnhG family)
MSCEALIVKPEAQKSCDSLRSFWTKHIERKVPVGSDQVLLVIGETLTSPPARIYLIEKIKGRWKPVDGPIEATAGRDGFALPGEKKEGDGQTPIGFYPLELAFGYAREISTKMAYRQALDDDVWVDDTNSPDYNRWVRRGETSAASFEQMRRKDNLYKYGIVIGYNKNPVVKGRGSAIFFHVWKGREEPTAGCIAMPEESLLRILGWLDPSANPLVVIGNAQS